MDDASPPLSPSPTAPATELDSLRQECASLRALLNWTLFLTCALAAALGLYLFREVSLARRQNAALRARVVEYETKQQPNVQRFQSELRAFAEANPGFRPVYQKYFPEKTQSSTSPADDPPVFNPESPGTPVK